MKSVDSSQSFKKADSTKPLKPESREVNTADDVEGDETRSVKAELNYKLKDAARHIVADSKKDKLRDKVL